VRLIYPHIGMFPSILILHPFARSCHFNERTRLRTAIIGLASGNFRWLIGWFYSIVFAPRRAAARAFLEARVLG
jgi:hypothetical protein